MNATWEPAANITSNYPDLHLEAKVVSKERVCYDGKSIHATVLTINLDKKPDKLDG